MKKKEKKIPPEAGDALNRGLQATASAGAGRQVAPRQQSKQKRGDDEAEHEGVPRQEKKQKRGGDEAEDGAKPGAKQQQKLKGRPARPARPAPSSCQGGATYGHADVIDDAVQPPPKQRQQQQQQQPRPGAIGAVRPAVSAQPADVEQPLRQASRSQRHKQQPLQTQQPLPLLHAAKRNTAAKFEAEPASPVKAHKQEDTGSPRSSAQGGERDRGGTQQQPTQSVGSAVRETKGQADHIGKRASRVNRRTEREEDAAKMPPVPAPAPRQKQQGKRRQQEAGQDKAEARDAGLASVSGKGGAEEARRETGTMAAGEGGAEPVALHAMVKRLQDEAKEQKARTQALEAKTQDLEAKTQDLEAKTQDLEARTQALEQGHECLQGAVQALQLHFAGPVLRTALTLLAGRLLRGHPRTPEDTREQSKRVVGNLKESHKVRRAIQSVVEDAPLSVSLTVKTAVDCLGDNYDARNDYIHVDTDQRLEEIDAELRRLNAHKVLRHDMRVELFLWSSRKKLLKNC